VDMITSSLRKWKGTCKEPYLSVHSSNLRIKIVVGNIWIEKFTCEIRIEARICVWKNKLKEIRVILYTPLAY
jgi:hypothetical protein